MSKPREEECKALENVLQTAVDGRKGFEQALEHCEKASPTLRGFLSAARKDCEEASQEVQGILTSYGVDAEPKGTISGDLHRGWNAVRSAFSPDEESAFLAEIVRGEEHAVKTYESALESVKTPHVREALESQLTGLRGNLTRARAFERIDA